MADYEKMSKSRGNSILIEEVTYGVRDIKIGYELRDCSGSVIDHLKYGVWQDEFDTKMFFTSTRTGRRPVFLHCKDNPIPATLLIDGEERLQHPNLIDFWKNLVDLHYSEQP